MVFIMKNITIFFFITIALAIDSMHSASPSVDYAPFTIKAAHKLFMLYGWTVFVDIAVLLIYYKNKKWTPYLHGFLCLALVVTTFATSLNFLLKNGFNTKHLAHYVIGVVIWGVMFFQVIIGAISLILQRINKTRSMPIYAIKKVHTYLGFALIILAKVQIFIFIKPTRTQFLPLLAFQAFALAFYLIRLPLGRKLTEVTVPNLPNPIKTISEPSELEQRSDCIIFANLIFDLTPLIKNHPAGFSVIEPLRGDQVDKYLYGMYRSESELNLPLHSHSSESLQLLEKPIARIQIASAYNGFEKQIVRVRAVATKSISNSIYEVRLIKKEGFNFQFNGIVSVSQLGRFYSLTKDDKVTRLYTAVNFLADKSKELFRKICFAHNEVEKYNTLDIDVTDKDTIITLNRNIAPPQQDYLPLMIKKYHKGKFTKRVHLLENHQLRLSCERGFGLEFSQLLPGRVAVLVGGTGLFPFCDLIDLLFKAEILKTANTQLTNDILSLYPLLKNSPFDKFSFEFYGSFQYINDIHRTILTQIAYLSSCSSNFKFLFKIKHSDEELVKRYSLAITESRFQPLISDIIQREGLSKVWVCGPPGMNHSLYAILSKQLPKDKFAII